MPSMVTPLGGPSPAPVLASALNSTVIVRESRGGGRNDALNGRSACPVLAIVEVVVIEFEVVVDVIFVQVIVVLLSGVTFRLVVAILICVGSAVTGVDYGGFLASALLSWAGTMYSIVVLSAVVVLPIAAGFGIFAATVVGCGAGISSWPAVDMFIFFGAAAYLVGNGVVVVASAFVSVAATVMAIVVNESVYGVAHWFAILQRRLPAKLR